MLLIFFNIPYINGQEIIGECFGVEELEVEENDLGAEEDSHSNCTNVSFGTAYPKYYMQTHYAPTPSNFGEIPIRTIAINFNIIQKSTPSDPGNFINTPTHLAFLNSLIDGPDGVNERYAQLSIPQRIQACVCGTECYIPDSRIRFILKGIHFQTNDNLYDNVSTPLVPQ